MASPATSNWPGSPSVPRPSPARPGQSPGGHPLMHSPQADHKTGKHFLSLICRIYYINFIHQKVVTYLEFFHKKLGPELYLPS